MSVLERFVDQNPDLADEPYGVALAASLRDTFPCRTSVHLVGSEGGRGVVGHNVGTFLQRARSGRGCSARASAGDRAVAAQGGLASLCRLLDHRRIIDAVDRCSWASVSESDGGTRLSFPSTDPAAKYFNRTPFATYGPPTATVNCVRSAATGVCLAVLDGAYR